MDQPLFGKKPSVFAVPSPPGFAKFGVKLPPRPVLSTPQT